MVLLLYTSHNSPSHQSWAIFYLGDDVSIRVCQALTAALWVVVLGESIVNQHNISRISLARACTTLGHGKAVHQTTAQPEHIRGQAHGHRQCLSISLALLTLFLCHSYTHTHRNSQIWQSQTTEMQEKETEIGQKECACQLFLTSFSVSSKVWGARKV